MEQVDVTVSSFSTSPMDVLDNALGIAVGVDGIPEQVYDQWSLIVRIIKFANFETWYVPRLPAIDARQIEAEGATTTTSLISATAQQNALDREFDARNEAREMLSLAVTSPAALVESIRRRLMGRDLPDIVMRPVATITHAGIRLDYRFDGPPAPGPWVEFAGLLLATNTALCRQVGFCQHCDKPFAALQDPKGGPLRRKYCSDVCMRLYHDKKGPERAKKFRIRKKTEPSKSKRGARK